MIILADAEKAFKKNLTYTYDKNYKQIEYGRNVLQHN